MPISHFNHKTFPCSIQCKQITCDVIIQLMISIFSGDSDNSTKCGNQVWRDVTKELARSGEHSTGYFDTKIKSLSQFLTELLQILLLKTSSMKNYSD